jgi:hypothetical protein
LYKGDFNEYFGIKYGVVIMWWKGWQFVLTMWYFGTQYDGRYLNYGYLLTPFCVAHVIQGMYPPFTMLICLDYGLHVDKL